MGGGERRAKYKKYSHKGKLKEKNSCTPINPKKYLLYVLKKIHTRNLITTKIPAARKFPPFHPHNFSNGPSLNLHKTRTDSTHALTFGGKCFRLPCGVLAGLWGWLAKKRCLQITTRFRFLGLYPKIFKLYSSNKFPLRHTFEVTLKPLRMLVFFPASFRRVQFYIQLLWSLRCLLVV